MVRILAWGITPRELIDVSLPLKRNWRTVRELSKPESE